KPGDHVARPPAPLHGVVAIPIHEPVACVSKPPRQLHWRLTVRRDALERIKRIDMNQDVSSIHASKVRLTFDRRDAVGVDNAHVETCASSSQGSRALSIDVAKDVRRARSESSHRKRRRTWIQPLPVHERLEVRAALESWIVRSERQESKSPVQSRRALRQEV